MCYAVPGKIIEIDGENAVIDYGGVTKTANASLIKACCGDYVLVHAGFAIQRLDKKSAEASLEAIRDMIALSEVSNDG
ncbi:MAG: HypC/HybG/HupF family hydrogenase formation chaperone [archaeon]